MFRISVLYVIFFFFPFYCQCYEKFNAPLESGEIRDYPLCGAQILSSMSAVKDSETCLRKSQTRNLNPGIATKSLDWLIPFETVSI